MKKEDKWLDGFRHRMKDYSEPVPDDLWNRLEAELDEVPGSVSMWRRWQVAATVCVLVISSVLTAWFWHSSSARYIEQQSKTIAEVALHEGSGSINSKGQQATEPFMPSVKGMEKKLAVAERVEKEMTIGTYNLDRIDSTETDMPAQQVSDEEPTHDRQPKVVAFRSAPENDVYPVVPKKERMRWSVGLVAGNIPYSASAGYKGYGRLMNVMSLRSSSLSMSSMPVADEGILGKADAYDQILFYNMSSRNVSSDLKHHMPVTLGVTLRYELDANWSLETGINYTLLSSELKSGDANYYYKDEQQLHYVGIPLKVSRSLWDTRRFSLYASAGGMVEKCVSGKMTTTYIAGNEDRSMETETLKVKHLQWSVTGAMGAQFNLTQQVGIYAEPGVVYYFDDGSEVSTIRKEHPFNFNLQVGVRFTLPK